MDKEYATTEERVWEFVKEKTKPARESFGKNISYGFRSVYGAMVMPLRIPTAVARFFEGRSLFHRAENIDGAVLGAGFAMGIVLDYSLVDYVWQEASQGNSLPAILTAGAVLAGNVFFGTYEVVKLIGKKERLEERVARIARGSEGTVDA